MNETDWQFVERRAGASGLMEKYSAPSAVAMKPKPLSVVHLLNRPGGLRHSGSSRLAFQIWPHAAQRQYVKALTSLLVVLTLTEVQKGQLLGAVISGFVYIPIAMQPGMSPGTA